MSDLAHIMFSWLTCQELPQEEFDKDFIEYFKSNPNGYDEAIKAVEQAPKDIREGIRERFNKLYEQAKKGRMIMTKKEVIELRQRLETFAKKSGEEIGSDENFQKLAEVCIWIGATWMANALGFKGFNKKGEQQ